MYIETQTELIKIQHQNLCMQSRSAGQAHSIAQKNKWRPPLGHSSCVFSKLVFRYVKSFPRSACIFGQMKKGSLVINLVQTSILSHESTVKMIPTLNEKRKTAKHLCVFLFRSFNIVHINSIYLQTFWTAKQTLKCSFLCITQDVCSYLWDTVLKIKSHTQHLSNLSEVKIKCDCMLRLTEPQNCQIGRDLQRSPCLTPAQSKVNQSRMFKVASSPILSMSRNEDSIGNLKYLLFSLICSLILLF